MMYRNIFLTVLPAIIIFVLSVIGYLLRNYKMILSENPPGRSDEMVFGHYWMVFSVINLLFLARLCGEHKWNIPYIPTSYVAFFFALLSCILIILWVSSILYLKVLANAGQKLHRRHIINLLGALSIFALSWALSGV